ncbi:MAG: cytochrome c oxidase subunit 3 [Alphaproteobacteria bacterium]|nr:cytochrome c oxidase subunit 3 [Alphaproteobacteria bacterium]
MNIMFLFLAVLATIVTWWLSQQRIAAKPWLEADSIAQAGAATIPAAKIGLGVFLAVVGALFALLLSAYSMRMEMGGWRAAPAPKLLWFNTAVLILSSSTLQWASAETRGRNTEKVRAGLLASGVLALVFLAGQLLAWRQLDAAGYYLTANPAAAFFFLITGLHGLHLLGGLAALGRTIDKTWRRVPVRELRLSVELCAIYWHFLLLVWLIFFGLLLLSDGSASNGSLVSLICRVF